MASTGASIDTSTNTLCGGPEPTNCDDGTGSFGRLCLKRLTEQADNVILIDAVTGEHITSVQLRDRSLRVAAALHAAGIRAGDTVGICACNRVEFALVLFGTAFVGATLAPLNVTYTESELQHAVGFSQPSVIFADADVATRIRAVAVHTSYIRKVIAFGAQYEAFVAAAPASQFDVPATGATSMDCVALILCSSGTTGMPKGVQLTQRNVMVGVQQHAQRPQQYERQLVAEPCVLTIIPWFHAYGCLMLVHDIVNRRRLVFLPKFADVAFLEAIQKYHINTLYMVPPLMVFLAKHPLVDSYDMRSLAIIWCGAAPLSATTEQAVRRRLAVPFIRQGYGMTEATLALCAQTDDCHTAGSVGRLRAGLWARVRDIETGAALPANRHGELCFRGSVIMRGYVGDAAATDAMIDADGWMHSGDVGYYTDGGEVFVVDRLKELIKYKGFQVPPAELEGILLQHPAVMDAAVVGRPDEVAGELPTAFVVRRTVDGDAEQLSGNDVVKFVAERTSPAKRLHGGVHFVDAIPKSPSGKILRRELRQVLASIGGATMGRARL